MAHPTEVTDRFGPSLGTFTQVTSWLTRAGAHVDYASPGRDLVTITASVKQAEALFGVDEQRFASPLGSYIANTAAPLVPAGLGLQTVFGLNTAERFVTDQDMQKTLLANGYSTKKPASTGFTPGPSTDIGNQTPAEIWGAYDIPAKTDLGAGQSAAVFAFGTQTQTRKDLTQFAKEYKFQDVPVVEHYVRPQTVANGTGEWDIDTQSELAMAPGLDHEALYVSTDEVDSDVMAIWSMWQTDKAGPHQSNSSFSTCEKSPIGTVQDNPLLDPINVDETHGVTVGTQLSNNLEGPADEVMRKAGLEGRTMFSSTGDTSAYCATLIAGPLGGGNGLTPQPVPLMGYPAISPMVVGVGGTVLYTNEGDGATYSRAYEYPWTYGGGGQSYFINAPDYQVGTPNLTGICLTDPSGTPSNTGALCRGIPDVSAISGDTVSNGMTVTMSGSNDSSGAGTSLSSPLWAGMWARIQSATKGTGSNGFANQTFYRLGKDAVTEAQVFHDIDGAADTGAPVGVGNVPYPAMPRWDYATGWGTPDVEGFIKVLGRATTAVVTPTGAKTVKKPTVKKPTKVVAVHAPGSLAATGAPQWLAVVGGLAIAAGLGLRRSRTRG